MEENSEDDPSSVTFSDQVRDGLEAIYIELDKVKFYLPDELLYKINNPDAEFILYVSVTIGVISLVSSFIAWKMGKKVKEKIPENIKKKVIAAKEFVVPPSGPRFRKRDKIAFVGQKMVKRVQAAGSYIRGGQGRKRKPSSRGRSSAGTGLRRSSGPTSNLTFLWSILRRPTSTLPRAWTGCRSS